MFGPIITEHCPHQRGIQRWWVAENVFSDRDENANARVAKLAYAPDLNPGGPEGPCRFDPCRVHANRRVWRNWYTHRIQDPAGRKVLRSSTLLTRTRTWGNSRLWNTGEFSVERLGPLSCPRGGGGTGRRTWLRTRQGESPIRVRLPSSALESVFSTRIKVR